MKAPLLSSLKCPVMICREIGHWLGGIKNGSFDLSHICCHKSGQKERKVTITAESFVAHPTWAFNRCCGTFECVLSCGTYKRWSIAATIVAGHHNSRCCHWNDKGEVEAELEKWREIHLHSPRKNVKKSFHWQNNNEVVLQDKWECGWVKVRHPSIGLNAVKQKLYQPLAESLTLSSPSIHSVDLCAGTVCARP